MNNMRPAGPACLAWIVCAVLAAPLSAQTTGAAYTIESGDTLGLVAQRAYGDALDWPAIMFATNRRSATLGFLRDPNEIEPGQTVWIPDAREKSALMTEYDAYVRAVQRASLRQPYRVTRKLRRISPGRPVDVITWARDGQYSSTGPVELGGDVWVTVVPEMQQFCRALGLGGQDLTLRLEQWLGLPPSSNKTKVVTFRVDDPVASMFRPCPDPGITTDTCPIEFPDNVADAHKNWIYSQYYGSFSYAGPTRFPWTDLGYTYDWGNPADRVGASEFIVRGGTTVTVQSITDTLQYCSAN